MTDKANTSEEHASSDPAYFDSDEYFKLKGEIEKFEKTLINTAVRYAKVKVQCGLTDSDDFGIETLSQADDNFSRLHVAVNCPKRIRSAKMYDYFEPDGSPAKNVRAAYFSIRFWSSFGSEMMEFDNFEVPWKVMNGFDAWEKAIRKAAPEK